MEIEIRKCKRMIKHDMFFAFFVFASLSFQQLFLSLQLKNKDTYKYMGGFFGTVKKTECVTDLFYGTDYNSHMGTKRAGMVTYAEGMGFMRSIHNLESSYFRTKFEDELPKFKGNAGIGVISDTDPQPILINSHLGKFAIVTVAKELNVEIQSLHAPYGGAASMWEKCQDVSIKALNELLFPLDACKKYNIPIMVVHTWIGFDNIPAPTKEGLDNYSKLVNKAKEYGVKIAFENTEGLDHLEALMEHFKDNDTVGFCWDSGHEMCYNHSKDLLAKFGNKLIMTHLNDNLGISRYDGTIYWTDDLHILPFDGVANWDYNVERLKISSLFDFLSLSTL